jgi:hypothetical protein
MEPRIENYFAALVAQDGRFAINEETTDYVHVQYRMYADQFANIGTTISCSKQQCSVACSADLPENIKEALKQAADATGFNFDVRDTE